MEVCLQKKKWASEQGTWRHTAHEWRGINFVSPSPELSEQVHVPKKKAPDTCLLAPPNY